MNFFRFLLILILLSLFYAGVKSCSDHRCNSSILSVIELPEHMSFNAVSASATTNCHLSKSNKVDPSSKHETYEDDDEEDDEGFNLLGKNQSLKLHLKRRSENTLSKSNRTIVESDLNRIQSLHTRILEKKNQNTVSRLNNDGKSKISPVSSPDSDMGQLVATLESGVSLGSGEYFMDVFVGTPPKHFSLILDTGSDLNWIQCLPCHDCFEQNGPFYDPSSSSSYKNVSCSDPRCGLVSSPDPPLPCKNESQSCPYYYWYGDSSNTTGDFALETFTVNLTAHDGKSEFKKVENVMFGCGHWNRGLFHGAAGLLGLGRGPLSFASQLQSLYGHSFSYCLVDRNSNTSVSSKLIFGEDKSLLRHPELNFTSLVAGKENPVDTFYYVQIKSIFVGGEALDIPAEAWRFSQDGSGGTIIDSGTTLSYFADPAYQMIKKAFVSKIKGYESVEGIPILDPCYNVSGIEKVELPEFGILFEDGAMWNFPVENYFIQLDSDEVICLAILGTPQSALSIIGNYQQQNFHILYDINKSRLGFAPTRCADV